MPYPPLHLMLTTQIGTEVWNIRLYTVPIALDMNGPGYGLLNAHAGYLKQFAPTPVALDESLLLDGGKRSDSTDGDITQGNPAFNNYELTFESDPALANIVLALRDLTNDLWCEITITMPVLDCPPLKPNATFWPRKTRSFFWGKVLRTSTTGAIDRQSASSNVQATLADGTTITNGTWITSTGVHVGSFKLSFAHWLKVIANLPTGVDAYGYTVSPLKDFLTNAGGGPPLFVDIPAPGFPVAPDAPPPTMVRVSSLFHNLLQYLSPSSSFAVDDMRIQSNAQTTSSDEQSVGQCNIVINATANNQLYYTSTLDPGVISTNMLGIIQVVKYMYVNPSFFQIGSEWFARFQVISPLFDTGTPSTISSPPGSPGALSLYNLADAAALLVALCNEFWLDFHVEIPTIADLWPLLGNGSSDIATTWPAYTRWIFPWSNYPLMPVYLDPDAGTIQYTPASNWDSSATYTEPTPQGFGPSQATVDFKLDPSASNPYSGKTLFRIAAYTLDSHDNVTFDYAGVELYVGKFGTTTNYPVYGCYLPYVNGPVFFNDWPWFNDLANSTSDWAYIHAYITMMRWGRPVATVEFDNDTRALEPYGASNANAPSIRRSFGVGDLGDFPRSRYFVMDPGMMHAAQKPANTKGGAMANPLVFQIYQIDISPGKSNHIYGIETPGLQPYVPSGNSIPWTTTATTTTTTAVKLTNPPPPAKSPQPPGPQTPPTGGPIGTILTPASGSVSGTVDVLAQIAPAAASAPVSNVKFFVDNVLTDFITIPNSPGGIWKFSWDSGLVGSGSHILTTVATDALGISTSTSVTVTT